VKQVEENCGALDFGLLEKEQMQEIDAILGMS
jgi:aryl-alcohol dehydrogenase-like predicted oxidoreductase